jgi:hypothetical protein
MCITNGMVFVALPDLPPSRAGQCAVPPSPNTKLLQTEQHDAAQRSRSSLAADGNVWHYGGTLYGDVLSIVKMLK